MPSHILCSALPLNFLPNCTPPDCVYSALSVILCLNAAPCVHNAVKYKCVRVLHIGVCVLRQYLLHHPRSVDGHLSWACVC